MVYLKPAQARSRVCSERQIDFKTFKAQTTFQYDSSLNYNRDQKEKCQNMFFSMVESMSNNERSLLLKFMCGRSRLQADVTHEVYFNAPYSHSSADSEDERLPKGETCGN